ncbi:hypothetical protein AsAng_0041410 [Aureispira anguillae]|uniref:Uncharacterized protein n=1 Tax=Aureispira anguillae TaxID=2864201 RepID=A0A916DTN6_9BACT|nr:hypothetical protein AsAng_0041410 [Aureispira anguillae]
MTYFFSALTKSQRNNSTNNRIIAAYFVSLLDIKICNVFSIDISLI